MTEDPGYCTSWAKDMQRCCPDTCGVSPVCDVAACNALAGAGVCTYPNPALQAFVILCIPSRLDPFHRGPPQRALKSAANIASTQHHFQSHFEAHPSLCSHLLHHAAATMLMRPPPFYLYPTVPLPPPFSSSSGQATVVLLSGATRFGGGVDGDPTPSTRGTPQRATASTRSTQMEHTQTPKMFLEGFQGIPSAAPTWRPQRHSWEEGTC